jgi:hypothetical protein
MTSDNLLNLFLEVNSASFRGSIGDIYVRLRERLMLKERKVWHIWSRSWYLISRLCLSFIGSLARLKRVSRNYRPGSTAFKGASKKANNKPNRPTESSILILTTLLLIFSHPPFIPSLAYRLSPLKLLKLPRQHSQHHLWLWQTPSRRNRSKWSRKTLHLPSFYLVLLGTPLRLRRLQPH